MEDTKQFEAKLEYQNPELIEYGSVEELTQLRQGTALDLDGYSGLD